MFYHEKNLFFPSGGSFFHMRGGYTCVALKKKNNNEIRKILNISFILYFYFDTLKFALNYDSYRL